MAKHPLRSDEYWLQLIQLYLRKPIGAKSLYSKPLVDLSLELHIPPRHLYQQLFHLRQIDDARLKMLWKKYGKNTNKLNEVVEQIRQMKGFGLSDSFYDGVELQESFERDFRPTDSMHPNLTPLHLIVILDLYFRLTPSTMVEETPEIQELAKLMKLSAKEVVEVMDAFQFCDPILRRDEFTVHPLLDSCREIWDRYGNDNPEKLAAEAAQMKDYFK